MKRKVGIYSGAFDPVHTGHVAFALEAARECSLDKVFFLVEPRPRHKQGVKAVEHRQKMVDLAIRAHSQLGSISLDQTRFTVTDTLPVLLARFKGAKLHFLMGDDMLARFTDASWPHLDEFVRAVNLVIGIRKHTLETVVAKLQLMSETRGTKIGYKTFVSQLPAANSTHIRAELRQGRQPRGIDPAVYDYILKTGLYAPSDAVSPDS